MSEFTTPLLVSPLPDGRRWTIMREFKYHVGQEDSSDIITVPVGFITDFASVPRPFWAVIPRWGKHGSAAVVHDYLYKFLLWMLEQPQYKPLFDHFEYAKENPRKFADDIFLEGMTVLGVRRSTRLVMYCAVRLFGWLAWRQKEEGVK